MNKCAWCGGEFEDGEEWSSYESLLAGDPAVARLRVWLAPIPERFHGESLELELHPGECYLTARDELRRALFRGHRELRPDGRRAVMPHAWWHMLKKVDSPR